MTGTWEVWHYFDVWGDAEDGYQVNDKTHLRDIELTESDVGDDVPDEAVIRRILEKTGKFDVEAVMARNAHFDTNSCCDEFMEIDLDDYMPFLMLSKKQEA